MDCTPAASSSLWVFRLFCLFLAGGESQFSPSAVSCTLMKIFFCWLILMTAGLAELRAAGSGLWRVHQFEVPTLAVRAANLRDQAIAFEPRRLLIQPHIAAEFHAATFHTDEHRLHQVADHLPDLIGSLRAIAKFRHVDSIPQPAALDRARSEASSTVQQPKEYVL